MTAAALALLLSDARFPSGGHAHSGGVEQACDRALVSDAATLDEFLRGRLRTVATISAHVAAAVCARALAGGDPQRLWHAADAECDARMPSPAARAVSRRQGAQLARAAGEVLGSAPLRSMADPHHPVALGAVAAAAGLSPADAAGIAAYGAMAGAASAALRLLGLDPSRTAASLARLAGELDRLSAQAEAGSLLPLARLPCPASPVADLLAEAHRERKERLFAS